MSGSRYNGNSESEKEKYFGSLLRSRPHKEKKASSYAHLMSKFSPEKKRPISYLPSPTKTFPASSPQPLTEEYGELTGELRNFYLTKLKKEEDKQQTLIKELWPDEKADVEELDEQFRRIERQEEELEKSKYTA